jgi:Ion transport protein
MWARSAFLGICPILDLRGSRSLHLCATRLRTTTKCSVPPSSPPTTATDRSPAPAPASLHSRPAANYPPGDAPFARPLHMFLNNPVTEVASALLVLGTCLVFALQTLNLQGWPGTVLLGYERFVSALFVSEYFLRWYAVGFNPRFLLTRAMLVDFCAIILPVGLAGWLHTNENEFAGLFVRALRFARVFQLQRVMSDEEMTNIFGNVPQSRIRIANVLLTVFNIIYVSAGLFYVC